jgi:hypothetical protein
MCNTVKEKAERYRKIPFALQTYCEKDSDFVARMETVFINDLVSMIQNSEFEDIKYSQEVDKKGNCFLNVRLKVKKK